MRISPAVILFSLSLFLCACGGGGGSTSGSDSGSSGSGSGGSTSNTARSIKLPSVTLNHVTVPVAISLGDGIDPLHDIQAVSVNVATWEPVCATGTDQGITDAGDGSLLVDTACIFDDNVLVVTAGTSSSGSFFPGDFHAYLTRSELMNGRANLSQLTEAAYAQVGYLAAANYSVSQIHVALDQSAKELLRDDIDGSGTIDRDDLPAWQPTKDAAALARVIATDHTSAGYHRDLTANAFTDYIINQVAPGSGPNATNVAVQNSLLAFTDSTTHQIFIYDISSPSNPVFLSSIPVFADVLLLNGARLYAISSSSIAVVDISNPAAPIVPLEKDRIHLVVGTTNAQIEGSVLYVTLGDGFKILDVTDPLHPAILGAWDGGNINEGLLNFQAVGSTLVATTGTRLLTFNIADPANPIQLAQVAIPSLPLPGVPTTGLVVSGNTAYAGTAEGIEAFDVSDPSHPKEVGQLETLAHGRFTIADSTLYVAGGFSGIWRFDISNPSQLKSIDRTALPSGNEVNQIVATENVDYVAGGSAGVVLVAPHPQRDTAITGTLDIPGATSLDSVDGQTLWVLTNTYTSTNGVYSKKGAVEALAASEPNTLKITGTSTRLSGTADRLRINGNFGYLSGQSGLSVLNLVTRAINSQGDVQSVSRALTCKAGACYVGDSDSSGNDRILRLSDPNADGTFSSESSFSLNTLQYFGPAADIAVDGNKVYAALSAGLTAIDFTGDTPSYVFQRGFSGAGVALAGSSLVSTTSGFGLFSVINPGGTRQSNTGTSGYFVDEAVSDGAVVYMLDGARGVLVFDVVDPAHPQFIGQIRTNGATDIKIFDGHVFVTNALGVQVALTARALPSIEN